MDTPQLLLSERENPENWEREYRENPDGFKDALREIEKTHGNLVLVRAWKARLVDVVASKFPRSFWYVMGATIVVYMGVAYVNTITFGTVGLPAMMWIVPFLLHYIWINKKQMAQARYVAAAVVLFGVLLYLPRFFVVDSMAEIALFSLYLGVFGLGGFFVYTQSRRIDDVLDVVTRLSSWVLLSLALLIPILGILFASSEVLQLFGQGDHYLIEFANAVTPFIAYYILERSQGWLKISQLYSKILIIPLFAIAGFIFLRVVYFLLRATLAVSFTGEFFGVGLLLLVMMFIASLIMKRTKNIFSFEKFESWFFGLISGVSLVLSICAVVTYFEGGSQLWSSYPELVSHGVYLWGLTAISLYLSLHAGLFAFAAFKRQMGIAPSYQLPVLLFVGYPLLCAGIITATIISLS